MAQQTLNTPRETTIQRIATALENILNKIVDTSSAGNIDYDNTESGLSANKAQGAIDELASEKADKSTTLAGYGITNAYTKAEVNDALNNNVETIAEAIKQWNTSGYTIDLYGIGLPDTYYPASSTYSGNRYLDVNTGIMYDCEQTGASTYTWRQAPVNLRLKTDINASAIEDIQEDISQSLSATGNPLTIESSESNLVECVAEVEAYQDLHGYDHPWVGGAGKNKLDTSTTTIGGITFTEGADGYISATPTTGDSRTWSYTNAQYKFPLKAGNYKLIIDVKTATTQVSDGYGIRDSNNTNLSQSGDVFKTTGIKVIEFSLSADSNIGVEFKQFEAVARFMIMSATETDSTFEPYSNISPISGRSEVAIQRDYIDWSNPNGSNVESVSYSFGVIDLADSRRFRNIEYHIPIQKTGIQHMSIDFNVVTSGSKGLVGVLDGSTVLYQSAELTSNSSLSFDFYANRDISLLLFATRDNEGGEVSYSNIIFNGQNLMKTYTIQLGDTIYGGELDVLTGKLRVTHGEVDLGDLTWSYNSNWNGYPAFFSTAITNIKKPPTASGANMGALCSIYRERTRDYLHANNETAFCILADGRIGVRDSRYSSAPDYTTAVTGQMLVYELAEPYTIQLTPQQIRLLKGTNNISCNTGDLSIKYYPDNVLGQLKGDIEKGLNAYYDYQIQALWDKINELQA